MFGKLLLATMALVLTSGEAFAQEMPSLADAARKARAEKGGSSTSGSPSSPPQTLREELVHTFAEAAAIASRQETGEETHDYFANTLMPDFGKKFAPALKSCFDHVTGADSGAFEFIAAIAADGRVLRFYQNRQTSISQCALPSLQASAFPRPPVHPFYLHIEMRFSDDAKSPDSDKKGKLPLVLDSDHSYTFGIPDGWEYDFDQAQERGALLAFFPKGGTFSGSKNVIYVNELNDSCKPDCKGHLSQAIAEQLAEIKQESPGVQISSGSSLHTVEGSVAEVQILVGSKNPRSPDDLRDKEALAFLEHKEAIVLVVLTVTDSKTWDQDYKAFQTVVRGHRFFTCDSPSCATLPLTSKEPMTRTKLWRDKALPWHHLVEYFYAPHGEMRKARPRTAWPG